MAKRKAYRAWSTVRAVFWLGVVVLCFLAVVAFLAAVGYTYFVEVLGASW
jgi:hypothetical protein